MTGFAHADHDHAALAAENQLAGTYEVTVDALQQVLYRLDFQANGALCGLNQVGWLAH